MGVLPPKHVNHWLLLLLLLLLQGTGQIGYAIPSGDGFVTDPNVIKQFNGKGTKTSRYTIKGA